MLGTVVVHHQPKEALRLRRVWVHAMQAAQVEPSSLSHKGLAGWLGWLAGWLWVQGRRPYAKPGSQCLKGADWLAGTS